MPKPGADNCPNAPVRDSGARSQDQAGGSDGRGDEHTTTCEQGVQAELLADQSVAQQQRNADLEQVGAAASCALRVPAVLQRLHRVYAASAPGLCSAYAQACVPDRRTDGIKSVSFDCDTGQHASLV